MTQIEVLKLARKTLALCSDHPWRSQAIAELDKLIEQKSNALAQPEQEQHKQEPVAHVLFRQDDDGLEPIMFYPPTTAPDPQTLKDRFILKDVWLSPPQRKSLADEPNLFWNNDDPEMSYGSIDEFLNDEWFNGCLEVGDVRAVQRAIRLQNETVRVTVVTDDGDIEYETIEARLKEKNNA